MTKEKDKSMSTDMILLCCLVSLLIIVIIGLGIEHNKNFNSQNQTLPLNQSEQIQYLVLGYNTGIANYPNIMLEDLIKYQQYRTQVIYNNQSIPIVCQVIK